MSPHSQAVKTSICFVSWQLGLGVLRRLVRKPSSCISACVWISCAWIGFAAGEEVRAESADLSRCKTQLSVEKSLLIRDLSVVESDLAQPGGVLHFASVLNRVYPGLSRSDRFSQWIESWFSQFSKSDRSDAFFVKRRPERILQFWQRDSSGSFDPSQSPFRLLAVVVRTDLISNEAPEGELRFVYSATDPWSSAGVEFLVILEFAFEGSRQVWSRAFRELSCLPFGEDFNRNLRAQVTAPGLRFLRLRSNDFMMGRDWELREFRMNPNGDLALSPVAQTPRFEFTHSEHRELLDWARANEFELQQETATLPAHLTGFTAPVPHESFSWLRGAELKESTRAALSKMTCNGCHAADTATVFTHIFPRGLGQRARISAFLSEDLVYRARIMDLWSQSLPVPVHQAVKRDSRLKVLRSGRVH